MKATEQYFPVVLFIMLYEVVLTFESVDKIQKYNHSNKSYWAIYCAVQLKSVALKCVKKRLLKLWAFK